MDAYVFAQSATEAALAVLAGGVGSGGPARVVAPLTGDRALYAAVAAGDRETLRRRAGEVAATDGLSGTTVYVPVANAELGIELPAGASFPTHVAVDVSVGFAVLAVTDVADALPLVWDVEGVIGVAVVTGDPTHVLVEVTAADGTAAGALLDALDALPGATAVFRATGETALGTGFRRR